MAPNQSQTEQRSKNLRTGLILAAIAVGFFCAVIVQHWLNP